MERNALNPEQSAQTRHPLALFSLDDLAQGASRLRQAPALADDDAPTPLSYGAMGAQIAALASHLSAAGLRSGENILIIGAPTRACALAPFAALAAGLDATLASAASSAAMLAQLARDTNACPDFGPTRCGDLEICPRSLKPAPARPTCVWWRRWARTPISSLDLDPSRLAALPDTQPARGQNAVLRFLDANGVRRWRRRTSCMKRLN